MRFYVVLLFIIACCHSVFGYGLGFYDSSRPIDERTTYEVYANRPPVFKGRFHMDFDLSIMPPVQSGYIFRIKTDHDNNGLIYNLHVDPDAADNYVFRLNQEGKEVLITLPIDKEYLIRTHWFNVGVDIDMDADIVSLTVGGKKMSCRVEALPDEFQPQITFGRSDYFIDVPTMAINNLRIDGDKPLMIPFNEDVGNAVSDSDGYKTGSVQNPIWLINSAYHWKLESRMASSTQAGSTYDMDRHQFYYFNRDTLKVFNPATNSMESRPFIERCPVNLFLANSFKIPGDDRMYVYEVYPKDHAPGPFVASVDLEHLDWRSECETPLKMQLHHHDLIYNEADRGILFFGGFGNMYYSNTLYSFIPGINHFTAIDTLSGDVISPRYFTAMGHMSGSNYAYIFGGMGNDSGEQIVGRRYFYDLHRLDLRTGEVKRLWDLPAEAENTVPARGMAVVGDHFFVLRYPESKSSSYLKLYRFSLQDGSHTVLGDSIPIKSDKITTNAHLWYDQSDGKFYVSVQETDDDISSTLKIYSLGYPAVNEATFKAIESKGWKSWMWFLFVVSMLIVFGVAFMLVRNKRRHKAAMPMQDGAQQPVSSHQSFKKDHRRPNSIYLFGNFEAVNSAGREIGYMFTARLRAILFLILQHNSDGGISSSTLGSLIWPDKTKDKVKNSRGVAINSLRKILGEFKDVTLTNTDSRFHLEGGPGFYCDYLRCMQLVSDEELLADNRREFLEIVGRGKFLNDFEDSVTDDFKREVESRLETSILRQIESTFETGYYRECISLVQAEFNIDPLNEHALRLGIRSMLYLGEEKAARRFYRRYAEEYLKSSGEKTPISFEGFLTTI